MKENAQIDPHNLIRGVSRQPAAGGAPRHRSSYSVDVARGTSLNCGLAAQGGGRANRANVPRAKDVPPEYQEEARPPGRAGGHGESRTNPLRAGAGGAALLQRPTGPPA